MRINKSKLYPIYHQYSNPENRLTHALLHTIASSEWIFQRFIKDAVSIVAPLKGKTFEACTQKVPLQQSDSDPEKVASIPDAWIIDDCVGIGLAIEVKDVKNNLSIKQLESHSSRILRYQHPCLLVITPDLQRPKKLSDFERNRSISVNVQWRSWDWIYRWLISLSVEAEKRDKENFIINAMLEYLERRREVLGFQGIFFRNGFDVTLAKEILNAEMETLQPSFNEVYPDLTRRRPAITTFSNHGVWDCFGNDEGFTSDIHFTFSINEDYHDISMTIPNSATKIWKRLQTVFSSDESESELYNILRGLRSYVPNLFIELVQRHFESRRHGIRDGYMEFNIDTLGAPFRSKSTKVKEFPIWKLALKESIQKKKDINAQVMFKSRFYLKNTQGIDKPEYIETAVKTIREYKPLYAFLRDK